MGMSHHLVNILTPTELYTLKVSFMACELYLSKTNERKIGDPRRNCVILGKLLNFSDTHVPNVKREAGNFPGGRLIISERLNVQCLPWGSGRSKHLANAAVSLHGSHPRPHGRS